MVPGRTRPVLLTVLYHRERRRWGVVRPGERRARRRGTWHRRRRGNLGYRSGRHRAAPLAGHSQGWVMARGRGRGRWWGTRVCPGCKCVGWRVCMYIEHTLHTAERRAPRRSDKRRTRPKAISRPDETECTYYNRFTVIAIRAGRGGAGGNANANGTDDRTSSRDKSMLRSMDKSHTRVV